MLAADIRDRLLGLSGADSGPLPSPRVLMSPLRSRAPDSRPLPPRGCWGRPSAPRPREQPSQPPPASRPHQGQRTNRGGSARRRASAGGGAHRPRSRRSRSGPAALGRRQQLHQGPSLAARQASPAPWGWPTSASPWVGVADYPTSAEKRSDGVLGLFSRRPHPDFGPAGSAGGVCSDASQGRSPTWLCS